MRMETMPGSRYGIAARSSIIDAEDTRRWLGHLQSRKAGSHHSRGGDDSLATDMRYLFSEVRQLAGEIIGPLGVVSRWRLGFSQSPRNGRASAVRVTSGQRRVQVLAV